MHPIDHISIWGLNNKIYLAGIFSSPQKKFRGPVPESYHTIGVACVGIWSHKSRKSKVRQFDLSFVVEKDIGDF